MANTNNTCTEPLSAQPKLTQAEITGDENVLLFTAGKTNQATLIDAVSKANELNAYLFVKSKTVNLTTAQVLTLNTTPVAFGITVPVGYFVQPLSIQCGVDFNTVAYATNTSLSVRAVGADVAIGASGATALAATLSKIFNLNININTTVGQTQFIDGVDLEVFVGIGNPTAGDSDIALTLTYVLIPTPI